MVYDDMPIDSQKSRIDQRALKKKMHYAVKTSAGMLPIIKRILEIDYVRR